MKKVKLFEEFINEASMWDKVRAKSKEMFGEWVLDALDEEDIAQLIDLPEADRIASKYFNEYTFMGLSNDQMGKLVNKYPNVVKESAYAYLGGNSNFTDAEMRKNVVEPNLGKKYDAYIMFEGPKGQYDAMKRKYANDTTGWKNIYRSSSYQGEAYISPDGKVIKAAIFANAGIVGAIYVKK